MNPYIYGGRRLKHNRSDLTASERDQLRTLRDDSRGKTLMSAMFHIRPQLGDMHAEFRSARSWSLMMERQLSRIPE